MIDANPYPRQDELTETVTPKQIDEFINGTVEKVVHINTPNGFNQGETPRPIPLVTDAQARQPYPIDCLGTLMKQTVEAVSVLSNTTIPLSAQSVLGVASLCVQGIADIKLATGATKPISLFQLAGVVTGDAKSSADFYTMEPVIEYEKRLFSEYQERKEVHKIAEQRYIADKKRLLNDDSLSPLQVQKQLTQPQKPISPEVNIDKFTAESIGAHAKTSRASQALITDEGRAFFGDHGFQSDRQSGMTSILIKLWDGGIEKTKRAGLDETRIVKNKRLTAQIMMQPLFLAGIINNREMAAQGFLSRFFIIEEEERGHERKYDFVENRERKIQLERFLDIHWKRKVSNLLRRPLNHNDGDESEVLPDVIRFDDAVLRPLQDYMNDLKDKIHPDGPYYEIKDFINKCDQHIARLAAVLTLFENPDAQLIELETAKDAIKLFQWYIDERLRLYSSTGLSEDDLILKQGLEWLKHKSQNVIKERGGVKAISHRQFGKRITPRSIGKGEIKDGLILSLTARGVFKPCPDPSLFDLPVKAKNYIIDETALDVALHDL